MTKDKSVLNAMSTSFSVIYRQGKVMHDKTMKQFGLNGQQMGYLRYIYNSPGASQEEIAKKLKIDKGAVAKAIKDMENKGYVMRNQNPNDKRAYCLSLTEKAESICVKGEKYSRELEKKLTAGMTDEEVKTFKVLLGKVTGNIAEMLEGGKI